MAIETGTQIGADGERYTIGDTTAALPAPALTVPERVANLEEGHLFFHKLRRSLAGTTSAGRAPRDGDATG